VESACLLHFQLDAFMRWSGAENVSSVQWSFEFDISANACLQTGDKCQIQMLHEKHIFMFQSNH
jgi:hypothetical protein